MPIRRRPSYSPQRPPREPDAEPEPFLVELLGLTGLCSEAYRPSPLQRRLPACLRALRAGTVGEARAKLAKEPDLLGQAIAALLLGVTDFFRDAHVFEDLARLLVHLSPPRQSVRVWSTACSNGAELYSVAMLLSELDMLEGSELLGTDCRPEAIEQARRGEYPRSTLLGVSESRLKRFFCELQRPELMRVDHRLICRTQWRLLNLLAVPAVSAGFADPLFSPTARAWDVILWRNHGIYLNDAWRDRLWDFLVGALAPGGLFVTGRAERPPPGLPLAKLSACVYRKSPGSGHQHAS